MKKFAFIDVGELGWSLYLSAHVRWLKKNTDSIVAVICLPERKCLYEDLADDIIDIPKAFYEKYDLNMQDSFKLRHVRWRELATFFLPCIPRGYRMAEREEHPYRVFMDNRIYAPYKYSKLPKGVQGGYLRTEILVFPRCRSGLWAKRNLPEVFYSRLIERLCDEFPELIVRTSGTKNGAYNMKIDRPNYKNWVGKESNGLQDLIDNCQSAIAAVGGASALPKISLLQGVPTFIIGYEKEALPQKENWMNTKVGFYETGRSGYVKLDIDNCIQTVVAFVRESNE